MPSRTTVPILRRAAAALLALTALVALASPAAAATAAPLPVAHPDGCPPDPDYSYSNIRYSHIQGPPATQGPPGHTLSISLTAGMSVTATATGTVSGGLSAIVAGARVDVSASLAVALTASVTYGDSWTVPAAVHQGFLAVGASSRLMDWTHGSYTLGCQWLVNAHGTLNAPYHLPAFWSWTS